MNLEQEATRKAGMDGWIRGNGPEEVWLYRVGEPDEEGRVTLFDDPEVAERHASETNEPIYVCRYTLAEKEVYVP